MIALGTLLAALVSRRLTGGLQRVAVAAQQVPMGRCDATRPTEVREIDQIASALADSAQAIMHRTEERDRADRAMRQTADQLRELNETLEERIAGEFAERMHVEAALRQAQKMEAVGQLTGGVAHDFNNLLQVVSASWRRCGSASGRDDPSKGDRAAPLCATPRCGRAARRGPDATPAGLLAPAAAGAGSRSIEPAGRRDVGSAPAHLGESVAIETVLAGGVWPMFADPNQLENAVLNLAVNARDAMPDGGKLTIETANTHLDEVRGERGDRAGQYVLVAVSDTGAGMTPEVIDKAFDPFFTTKDVGQGTRPRPVAGLRLRQAVERPRARCR